MNLNQLLRVCLCFYLLTFLSISLVTTTALANSNEAIVVYSDPLNEDERLTQRKIKASGVVDTTIEFINETFALFGPLTFEFGGEDGPLYDGDSGQILIPYSFIQEVEQRFADTNYSETGISHEQATMDVLMHTLFHELAHALIHINDVPIVGKEEDAADGLASVLLIEFFEDGSQIALSAADLFGLESEDKREFENDDFMDEHSLDIQRFYTTLCHIYGSDPETYNEIPDMAEFSQDRTDLCIQEYSDISRNWLKLLAPFIKQN